MEYYLLKSTLCLAILYFFYKWVLEKENMHVIKRFYLLGGILASFVVPVITFTRFVEVPKSNAPITTNNPISILTTDVNPASDYSALILWTLYIAGVIFFAFKFGKNLRLLLQKIHLNERVRAKKLFLVLLNVPTTPHTFFQYIFVNKEKFQENQIPNEVLMHEQVHVNQKHSIDTLFVELLQIIFWFNPMIYLLKQSIKLNHEFLADQGVLEQGTDKSLYQYTLLAFSSGASTPIMANSINYSSIKKRFTVMKTNTSTRTKWLKGLMVLPLLSLLLYGFSNRKTVLEFKEPYSNSSIFQEKEPTPKEIAEYNRLAGKYNAQSMETRVVLKKDIERMEDIYGRMTVSQKEASQPFPECPPPPQPPAPPVPPVPPVASLEPIDHIIRMANQNAAFFYEDHGISSDKAIALIKDNSELNIETTTFKNSNPIVKITSKPFIAPPDSPILPEPDPAAKIVEIAKRGGTFYMDGKKVSSEKAIEALRTNKGLKVEIDETDPDHPKVKLSSC